MNVSIKTPMFAVGAVVLGLVATNGAAFAAEGLAYSARAVGAQEVPEVGDEESLASATGTFRFTRNLSKMITRVSVSLLDGDVTAAHLHCAPAGQNGDVIVDLKPATDGNRNLIVLDVFTNDDIELDPLPDCVTTCGFFIPNIAALRAAAQDGCLYLNVHSNTFASGEVRGQLLED